VNPTTVANVGFPLLENRMNAIGKNLADVWHNVAFRAIDRDFGFEIGSARLLLTEFSVETNYLRIRTLPHDRSDPASPLPRGDRSPDWLELAVAATILPFRGRGKRVCAREFFDGFADLFSGSLGSWDVDLDLTARLYFSMP
jgi:hypothetical protein